jgi:hypothetical protein
MADATFMYGVTTGIFAFLVAILFGSRARRKHQEPEKGSFESQTESYSSSSSGSEESGGRRIKRFKSDGTPA